MMMANITFWVSSRWPCAYSRRVRCSSSSPIIGTSCSPMTRSKTCSRRVGASAHSGSVIASLMVLQTLPGHSDRETAESVTLDLRWETACGFSLTEVSFHPTALRY